MLGRHFHDMAIPDYSVQYDSPVSGNKRHKNINIITNVLCCHVLSGQPGSDLDNTPLSVNVIFNQHPIKSNQMEKHDISVSHERP